MLGCRHSAPSLYLYECCYILLVLVSICDSYLLVFRNVDLRYRVIQHDPGNNTKNALTFHRVITRNKVIHEPWIVPQARELTDVAFYLDSIPGCHLYFCREGSD